MTKVLYIVMSGKEAEQRFDMALISATRIAENKMVENLKVLFFGPSELLLSQATGERAEKIKKLIELGVVDSACVMIAKNMNIETELKTRGINLEGYSSRFVALLGEGYTPVTF
ncbi:MAG: hypothetical protein M0Z77_01340 [Thermoplasmatales archaeon]|jgi:hypothetical protein|nr:hypothetical protein [Candidatus Thermoplasmatota archaeon]MDA8054280.1 hypothetical protein [Thermoplasmatales archaeon]